MDIKKRSEEIFEELVAIRRDLHMYPELSGKELRTSGKICEYLDRWGIEYISGVADTGIVAVIQGKKEGRTVAARADMDALPVEENSSSPYKSQNTGIMHACGHDVHMTILLGIAKLLKEMEEELPGKVKLLFQPAEEAVGGAQRMVAEGCMENPDVDYVIGLHVMPYIDAGYVELKYGKLNASSGEVYITIRGKSGHGAYPDITVDAIMIAGHVITALQSLVSRSVSPLDSVVLTIGKINGGTKDNIIADKVVMSGTLRTLDASTRKKAKEIIARIAENTAKAHGGEAEVEFADGYDALINDDEVVDIIKKNAERIVGSDRILFKEHPSMGAEDFSYFLDKAKGAFFHLGCGNKEKGITASLHSCDFKVDEACIKTGVQLQLENILSLLKK